MPPGARERETGHYRLKHQNVIGLIALNTNETIKRNKNETKTNKN